jgi:hypothetical protein
MYGIGVEGGSTKYQTGLTQVLDVVDLNWVYEINKDQDFLLLEHDMR